MKDQVPSGKRRKGKILRILAWVALGISPLVTIVTLVYVSIPDFDGEPHLADEELIGTFHSHQADFDRLLQMVLQNKQLTRVDDDWTEPRDPKTIGVSEERVAEYRKLFRVLGIKHGFSAPQNRDHVQFLASTRGWVSHGSEKGYLYAIVIPDHLGPVRDSLDQLGFGKRPIGSGCRHIQGNWYLYFSGD